MQCETTRHPNMTWATPPPKCCNSPQPRLWNAIMGVYVLVLVFLFIKYATVALNI